MFWPDGGSGLHLHRLVAFANALQGSAFALAGSDWTEHNLPDSGNLDPNVSFLMAC